MDAALAIAIGLAFAFALTNGFHDASNAIATLVATRAATPAQAIALAAVFNMLGPILVGSAVAATIAGIVQVPADQTVAVIGAGLIGATSWNLLTWWRGLPSSSGQALVGGLVGAALVEGRHERGQLGRLRRVAARRGDRHARRARDLAGDRRRRGVRRSSRSLRRGAPAGERRGCALPSTGRSGPAPPPSPSATARTTPRRRSGWSRRFCSRAARPSRCRRRSGRPSARPPR